MLTWVSALFTLGAVLILGYLVDRHLTQTLDEQRDQLKELQERVLQIWQWTAAIETRTQQWQEHPRCELEQKLWLKQIGFTDIIRAFAEGRPPSEEEFDRVDKALGIHTSKR